MPLHPSFDPSDLGPRERRERLPGAEEERRAGRTWEVAGGTLACPRCDFPVMPATAVSIADGLGCPYCGHAGAARDFLRITEEPRPARVRVMATVGASGFGVERGERDRAHRRRPAGEGEHESTPAPR